MAKKKHAKPPLDDETYEARWQADFERLRAKHPSRWGKWVRPRLIFVHPWLARLYGGVFLWLGWIFVGRNLLRAPYFARQFMLARLWSHACHGHFFETMGIFLCTGAMTLLVQLSGQAWLGMSIGLAALGLMVWTNRKSRDLVVDDAVGTMIGRAGVQAGINWLIEQHLDTLTDENAERLRRMESPAIDASGQGAPFCKGEDV